MLEMCPTLERHYGNNYILDATSGGPCYVWVAHGFL